MTGEYRVYKRWLGQGHTVRYACPRCGEGLRSDLEEAGRADRCPVCGMEFRVPGVPSRTQPGRAAVRPPQVQRSRLAWSQDTEERVAIAAAVAVVMILMCGGILAVAALAGAFDSAGTVARQTGEQQRRAAELERRRAQEALLAQQRAEEAKWTKAREDAEQRLRTEIEYQRLLRGERK